ncbi:site-specific recombinase XerD [Salinibacter ruber]|uniref:site-specific integrase n=1 Tax=Salinibacter ruber TaxID=146919 RepID=UPI00216975F6|nr:site-specific integrase [Salinibacter ruber]MCS4189430.1 site-specific recombinase XerD [Salinibacter ruber]
MSDLIAQLRRTVPALLDDAGEDAVQSVLEFFTAEIRNQNTRKAYARAVRQFFDWAERRGLTLKTIEPMHVAAYVEADDRSASTVKQHLSAIRRLFDWLVTGQVLSSNPAAPVRPPKLVVEEGKTPVFTAEETRELLDSIVADRQDVGRLRDRALIGVMVFTFARVSAVAGLDVQDYYRAGHRWTLYLQEKGGKRRDVPVHHKAKEYLDEYLGATDIREQKNAPLFQSLDRSRELTGQRLESDNILQMVKRRAEDAGFDPDQVCCHTFRGTGITTYLENGGKLETAQHIAGHASATTTKLYDRRNRNIEQEEIERIRI